MKTLKYLPSRLSADAIVETLGQLGIGIPPGIEATTSREDMGVKIKAVGWKLGTSEIDAALAKTELSISERLRFKYALETIGIY